MRTLLPVLVSSIRSSWSARLAAGAVTCTLFTSCVTQEQFQTVQDENLQLKEERTRIKEQNRDLNAQLSQYETALYEANAAIREMESSGAQEAIVDTTPDHPELESQGLGVGTRNGDLVITLPNEVTFSSGSASLTDQGEQALSVVASTLLRDYDGGSYWVEGHTDSDPISRSGFESNRSLSMARAMAVLTYLVESSGVPDDDCVIAGHGEYNPVADNFSMVFLLSWCKYCKTLRSISKQYLREVTKIMISRYKQL